MALFLAGLILFNPPLLNAFGHGDQVEGWPLLILYLFGAWSAVIALLALHAEHSQSSEPPP